MYECCNKVLEKNVINSILRSYFTASGKATGKVRYYSKQGSQPKGA